MTRIVVHIDQIVLDRDMAAGQSRAELAATLTAGLIRHFGEAADPSAWAAAAVPRLAVAATGAHTDALVAAVGQALDGLAGPRVLAPAALPGPPAAAAASPAAPSAGDRR